MAFGVVTHSCFLLLSASSYSWVATDEAETRDATARRLEATVM
jgi:hypothetical protein